MAQKDRFLTWLLKATGELSQERYGQGTCGRPTVWPPISATCSLGPSSIRANLARIDSVESIAAAETRVFFEFSLCLSRACLGEQ